MKNGDFYNHYKGGEYFFDCIALPVGDLITVEPIGVARYHEDTHDIELFRSNDGVTFIESDKPHVIYQAKADYNTSKVYAREVDDFFGFVCIRGFTYSKRFALIE